MKNVKHYRQNSQCQKEGAGQLSSNVNWTSTQSAMSSASNSSIMGLAVGVCDSTCMLPSSTFSQGASEPDDSLETLGGLSFPDSVLSKPQQPLPLLSLHPKSSPDTNPVSPAPLDAKPTSLLHSGTSMSESHHLLLSQSCLSHTAGLQSQQTITSVPSEPPQTTHQISLLSTPLSNLSQSEGLLSGPQVTSSPLNFFQASSQHLLPSASLSGLSGQVGALSLSESFKTAPQNPPLLSCKPAPSSSSFPSGLLSVPLSTLSQTPTSLFELQPANDYQDSLLSASLSSLSQSGRFSLDQHSALSPPLSSVCIDSQTSEALESLRSSLSPGTKMPSMEVDLHAGKQKGGTTHSLGQKMQNMKMSGNGSKINPGEKGYNQNHKEEHKPSPTPKISPMFDPSVDQEEAEYSYASDRKPKAPPAKHSINIYNKRFCQKYVDQERQPTRTWDNTRVFTAKPTMFALALCYSTHVPAETSSANKTAVQNIVKELYSSTCVNITPFDFCSPSPDDVVNEKQKGAFSRKK